MFADGSGGWWWCCSSLRIVMEILGQRPPPCGLKIQQHYSNNGPELSSQMFSSGPNPAILKCLSSSLVVWSGLVWWCARGCAEVMYCLIINPKLMPPWWPSIRRCLQSAAGHDDQLMIPVSSTLSSAPSPHSPMASGAMAMEQIV